MFLTEISLSLQRAVNSVLNHLDVFHFNTLCCLLFFGICPTLHNEIIVELPLHLHDFLVPLLGICPGMVVVLKLYE